MIPMDEEGNILELSQNLNRQFVYVRYNIELSKQGMKGIGLEEVDPEPLRALDSLKHLDMLSKVVEKLLKSR